MFKKGVNNLAVASSPFEIQEETNSDVETEAEEKGASNIVTTNTREYTLYYYYGTCISQFRCSCVTKRCPSILYWSGLHSHEADTSNPTNPYPTASTCAIQLTLPTKYDDYEHWRIWTNLSYNYVHFLVFRMIINFNKI